MYDLCLCIAYSQNTEPHFLLPAFLVTKNATKLQPKTFEPKAKQQTNPISSLLTWLAKRSWIKILCPVL